MFYEIRCRLFFSDQDPVNDIVDKVIDHWPEAKVINLGLPEQECSEYQVAENHHDADPNEPCVVMIHNDNCPPP